MHTFHRKVVPIIVILNFMFSVQMISQLGFSLAFRKQEYPGLEGLAVGLLLIIVVNIIVIAIAKKRYGDKFSLSGYLFFAIIVPMISSVIMQGVVALISKLFSMLGVGVSIV